MSDYFTAGIASEQNLLNDLTDECISFWGVDFMYIPRTLIYVDQIFTEDRLSEFKNRYPIRGYFDQIDNFEGQGAFIQKFGLQMEQGATIVIAKRVWEKTIAKYGLTQLSNRPAEGDLIYWPLNNGLFEIKFVQHQNPFYQLGKQYVYRLEIELFQYSSEKIDTGYAPIDVFEDLKSHDVTITSDSTPVVPQLPANAGDNQKFIDAAPGIGFNGVNIFGDVE